MPLLSKSNPSLCSFGVPPRTVPDTVASLFGNDELSDANLKCSDGGIVPIVKAILGARSTVFRHLFFGEQKQKTTGMKEEYEFNEWDSRVLWLIVEYCYLDLCSIMDDHPSDDVARILAHLRVASKAFRLPGLLEKINQWSWRQLNRYPGLCCAMIDEGLKMNDIDEIALQTVQIKSKASMIPDNTVGSGVLSLSKSGLLYVLRYIEESTSHLLLLKIIETWVEFGDGMEQQKIIREAFGARLATRFIKLSKIDPKDLESAMKRSNLLHSNADFQSSSPPREKSFMTNNPTRPRTAIGLVTTNTNKTRDCK